MSKTRERIYTENQQKAIWVLHAFSPGEIQSQVPLNVPYKVGRKYDSPIIERTIFTPGAGIPASTIARFQSGEYTPREKSIKKLAAMYDAYQLKNNRAVGMNKEDSKRYSKRTPEELTPIQRKYLANAKQIQLNYRKQGYDKSLVHILHGMAHSKHGKNDWDKLAMISGLVKVKPKRHRRKKGYGKHRE